MNKLKLSMFGGACLLLYISVYFLIRPFPSHYAVVALGRPWHDTDIKSETIEYPRFGIRSTAAEKFSYDYLEPIAYYIFLPLVEAELALNGYHFYHPIN